MPDPCGDAAEHDHEQSRVEQWPVPHPTISARAFQQVTQHQPYQCRGDSVADHRRQKNAEDVYFLDHAVTGGAAPPDPAVSRAGYRAKKSGCWLRLVGIAPRETRASIPPGFEPAASRFSIAPAIAVKGETASSCCSSALNFRL